MNFDSADDLQNLVRTSPIAICIINAATLVTEMLNDAFVAAAGKPYDAIYGKYYWDALPEIAPQYKAEMAKVIADGKPFYADEVEMMLVRHGREEWIFVTFVYMPLKNKEEQVTKIVVWAIENTTRVKERQLIQELNEELTAANEEMRATNDELAILNEDMTQTENQLQQLNNTLEERVTERTKQLAANKDILVQTQHTLHKLNEELEDKVKERTQALAESEARFRMITDNIAQLAWMAEAGGDIFWYNKRWHDYTGSDPATLKGLGWQQFHHPDYVEKVTQKYIISIADNEYWEDTFPLKGVDGNYRWFLSKALPLKDAQGNITMWFGTNTDITEQKNAQEILTRNAEVMQALNEELASANEEITAANEAVTISNEELILLNEELTQAQNDYNIVNAELVKHTSDLLFTIDAAGLGTFDLNPVTGRFSGNGLLKSWFGLAPEEEIELQKATDVIAEADRENVVKAIGEALQFRSGGKYEMEYTIINPGNPVPRIVRAKGKTLFDDKQKPVRLSGTVQDITEQKKDEQRKNDFIGMVSHELKTPLTSLSGYLQLLQVTTKGDGYAANMLDKATKQIGKMTGLINGFLNVSRLESGKIQIDKQRFDLALLIKETWEESVATITSHKVVFAPVTTMFVNADRDKIGHVINNLISNAVKYSAAGSTINIACITTDGCALVSVNDNGIGIKKEDTDKLFDRYYRVENDGTRGIAGFGIGLYLCAEIIYRHDGKIWVESEVGKGSTFYFSLPVL